MKYQVVANLTAERANTAPRVLWEGNDWVECKDQFNFWANEYRDSMDRMCIRVK